MTTLAVNNPVKLELGEFNDLLAVATDIIYEGAAVGLNDDGYARPLVAGDVFHGHAFEICDNSTGAAGDKRVRVRRGLYYLQLPVTGATLLTDGEAVYASDDNAYTMDPTGVGGSNSLIGRQHRYVSANVAVVEIVSPAAAAGTAGGLAGGAGSSGAIGAVEFFDDFLGFKLLLNETGSLGIYEDVIVGDATVGIAANVHGGAAALVIAATSEAEDAVLSFGDQKPFDIDSLETMEFRAKAITPGSGVTVVAGMAGDHNLDKDTVAQNAWFRLDANLALDVESDDGTTDVDDTTTAITLTTDVWYDFLIDFRDKTNLKFYVNGARVAAATVHTLAAYTGNLQPYFSLDKASGTGTGQLLIDYVRINAGRG